MKLLLDTNIIIPLEPGSAAEVKGNTPIALRLAEAATQGGHQLYIHPEFDADVNRDSNVERRKTMQLLQARYPRLTEPPPRSRVENLLGQSTVSPNDAVDNALLAAVHAHAVHWLVTEDVGIHRKARRLGIANRVVGLSDAIDLLRDLHGTTPVPPPHVRSLKAYSLDTESPIFESFREDYPGFDAWLRKTCEEHRDAWVVDDDNDYSAIMIVKREGGEEIGRNGSVLKLCSFKVADHANGAKLGELLLKTAIGYGRSRGCDWVYVTAFEKHAALIALLNQFGFEPLDDPTPRGELVLVKALVPDDTPLDSLSHQITYGPGSVRTYSGQPGHVIPIRPRYHDALFPECTLQPPLLLAEPMPYGCAVRKAYLCNAQTRRIARGDNIFFYRSLDAQRIYCTGVVEDTLVSSDPGEITGAVGVRTVYPYEEIKKLAADSEVLAILFRHDRVLRQPISLSELKANGVLKGAPQSIVGVRSTGLEWLERQLGKRS